MRYRLSVSRLHPALFIAYASSAAFTTYFCMYALRKPYTVAGYEALGQVGSLDFKTALILAQIMGYMLAKLIGIKVVSEMLPGRRAIAIAGMVLSAQAALLLFALTPQPWNIAWLFVNGLSLGMVWGLVISFLEGRQTSEMLGAILSSTFIVASGLVRTVGKWLMLRFEVSELWMPAATGGLFMPLLLLSVYLLSQLPAPSAADQRARQQREPMNHQKRMRFLTANGPGIGLLMLSFLLFTGLRDFRDNFSAELWTALGYGAEPGIFAYAGIRIAFIVLAVLGCMMFIRNNTVALMTNHGFIVLGALLMMASTYLFQAAGLDSKLWMVLLGAGLYIAYIPYNCFLFERMVAAVGITANAAFLITLADSAGYVGSVGILLYRSFAQADLSGLNFFIYLVYWTAGLGLALASLSALYFALKLRRRSCP